MLSIETQYKSATPMKLNSITEAGPKKIIAQMYNLDFNF